MTEERRYGINWVDLIIKVILLILFVLLICWLFPMPKLDTFYDKVFNDNIQTMKNAARNYYTVDRLPSAVGDTKTMTLKQLIDSKVILEFSDKDGNTCDTTNSYVQVTKTLDSEYALKVQLTCGDESDYIIDTIGCNGTCLLSEVNNTKDTANKVENDDDNDYYDVKLGGSTGSTGETKYYYYPLGSGSSNPTSTTTIIKYPETTTNTTNNDTTNNPSKKPSHTGSKKPNNNNNNSGNNNNNNYYDDNYENKTLYYQQAKIIKEYGNWIEGYKTGNNVETKTQRVNYYYYTKNGSTSTKTQSSEYRTTSYVGVNEFYTGKQYSYELQLTDIPSTVSNVTLSTTRFFNSSDYQKYESTRNTNLYMTGNDMLSNSYASVTDFKNSSLKSGNFTYNISNPYRQNGVWRVRVTITLRSRAAIPAYYDRYLNNNIYYVPVYFKVNYSGYTSGTTQRYLDTEDNAYKYSGYTRTYAYSDTVNYYRYITEHVDYNQTKWSTSRYLDGYHFTGNTKYM